VRAKYQFTHHILPTIHALFQKADYIFGCTGQDILPSHKDIHAIENEKVLISCSSGDQEFATILHLIHQKYQKCKVLNYDIFDTLQFRTRSNGIL